MNNKELDLSGLKLIIESIASKAREENRSLTQDEYNKVNEIYEEIDKINYYYYMANKSQPEIQIETLETALTRSINQLGEKLDEVNSNLSILIDAIKYRD